MAAENAPRDGNFVPATLFQIDGAARGQLMSGHIDQTTGRILVDQAGGGSGTVTSVSVVSANGLAGTVATPTTTPAITLSTTITGVLKGNGTAISAAAAGTDYQAPITLTTTGTSGASTLVGNTLNIPNYATGSGLTVGTTTITSGTDTRVLYDNAGVLGEYTIVGSGSVVLDANAPATSPATNTISKWDANRNLSANNLFYSLTSRATAGTTTAMNVGFSAIQVWTGTNTQTVTLPTTSLLTGGQYLIINQSTGAVTVQSSGGNTITVLAGGTSAVFTALANAPTTASQWNAQYLGLITASGKALTANNSLTLAGTDGKTLTLTNGLTVAGNDGTLSFGAASKTLTVNNSLTLAGTDAKTLTLTNGLTVSGNDGTLSFGAASKTLTVNKSLTLDGTDATTMTFPTTSATIARTDAGQTFTGTQVMTSPKILTSILDTNGNPEISMTATTSAVNGLTVTNAATGNAPTLSVGGSGSDTNAGLIVQAKGTGSINLNSGSYNTIQTYTPGAGGTATLDLSKGNIHHITMPAGNITIALSNTTAGQCFIVRILQDGTGSRTVTWFTTIKWAGGSAPTLTTTASKADTLGFEVTTAGSAYDGYVVGQNI